MNNLIEDEIKILQKSINSLNIIINNCIQFLSIDKNPNSDYSQTMLNEYINSVRNLEYDTKLLNNYKSEYPELFL